jgi:TolB-like protein/DNA-binding SARP family transcriptional activator/tetratricopeptide (TPR) repeat protein
LFHLKSFGGLALSSGAIVRPQPRRRLALLARIAASGERGVSRDELLAELWPERNEDAARHNLDQLLYELRKALGASPVAGTTSLRIEATVLSSDVLDFRAAHERSDYAACAALYAGDFLQGFHLHGAPGFERWVERTRDELAALHRTALEQLARSASARGADEDAVRWWRRLAALDRLSSPIALGLMHALVEAGDTVGAVAHAGLYERVVRTELETAPDPAVTSFAASLRGARDVATMSAPPIVEPRVRVPVTRPSVDVTVQAAAPSLPSSTSWRPRSRRPGWRTTFVGVAASAVLLVGSWRYILNEARPTPALGSTPASTASLVVLPVSDISAASAGFLADGMTEQLITALTNTSGLRVIGSASSYAFKGSDADIRRIADSLHVSNVLKATLQRDGQRLRVNVRLVDATTGENRWAHTFDRDLSDVFAVQDDIIHAVVRELKTRLTGGSARSTGRHQTSNIAAYEWYLRGSDPTLTRSDSTLRAGIEDFAQAIALDSTYAAAWAGLARLCAIAIFGGSLPPDQGHRMYARALDAAAHANALDDSLAEVHLALGAVHLFGYDLRAAEAEFGQARALDPGAPDVSGYLATLYEWTGRTAEAVTEARREVLRDPLSATAATGLAGALYYSRRYGEALDQLQKVASIRPPLRRAYHTGANTYLALGRWSDAIAVLRPLGPGFPRAYALLGYALGRSGARTEAKAILTDLRSRHATGNASAYAIAEVYAGLGDMAQAFAWYEKSIDDYSMLPDIMGPAFDEVRADPRFARLRARIR